jgi:hypothetical protein
MMSDPAVLFVRPKSISKADRAALRKAGVVVVEVDNPSEVRFLRPSQEISGGALLVAAAKAIRTTGSMHSVREVFGRVVCEAIEAEAKNDKAPPEPNTHT